MSEDRHAQPSARAREPLHDANIPTPTHAERARTLVARIATGTLCTLALEPEGYPYGSFVTVAFDEGDPVFLISALAEHTKNLERDRRASLMVAESGATLLEPEAVETYRAELFPLARVVTPNDTYMASQAVGTWR